MKRWIVLPILLTVAVAAYAQETWPKPSAASRAYSEYRQQNTIPSYGLAKIKAMIKPLKYDQDGGMAITEKQFNALTIAERFTYCMIHGEDENQNCDASPPIVDENLKIFAYTPPVFNDERGWSTRQRNFLTNNRAKVIGLLRETMNLNHRAGANLKGTIEELNAYELVPDLIALYKRDRKDHDLLTVMMVLMDEAKFPEFMSSTSWTKLFGPESNYLAYISANRANQDLVMSRAANFYHWKLKQ